MPAILVVDDEEPLRRYIARVLEDVGHRVLLRQPLPPADPIDMVQLLLLGGPAPVLEQRV